jgi:hypothetical protein
VSGVEGLRNRIQLELEDDSDAPNLLAQQLEELEVRPGPISAHGMYLVTLDRGQEESAN